MRRGGRVKMKEKKEESWCFCLAFGFGPHGPFFIYGFWIMDNEIWKVGEDGLEFCRGITNLQIKNREGGMGGPTTFVVNIVYPQIQMK